MRWNRNVPAWTLLFALLPVIAGVALVTYGNAHRDRGEAAECKQNLHAIQLALERYAVDSGGGFYPPTLSVLRDEAYLPVLPRNPYGKGPPMPEVPPGEHAPGGVTYILHYGPGDGAAADGYALLVYGREPARQRWSGTRPSPRMPLPAGAEALVPWEYVLAVLTSGDWAQPHPAR